MYPISAAAKAALVSGFRLYRRADVLSGGAVVRSGLSLGDDATVELDASAAVRRQFSATVMDPANDGAPLVPTSILAPFGNELAVYGGLYLPVGTAVTQTNQVQQADGTVLETWPVGVFGIEDPAEERGAGGDHAIRVQGYDRALSISERKLPAPYTIAAATALVISPGTPGARPGGAIADLIDSVRTGLSYSFDPTSATTPLVVLNEGADPWEEATKLAAAAGMELFFDSSGVCVLRSIPDPAAAPVVFTVAEGVNGTFKTGLVNLTSRSSASHAVAIGEPLDGTGPFRSDVYDTDPSSPTYYLGPFGDRPVFMRNQLMNSQASTDAAATGLLNRNKGGAQILEFTAVPNSALDPEDGLLVQSPSLDISSVFTLERATLPLGYMGEMRVTSRGRQV